MSNIFQLSQEYLAITSEKDKSIFLMRLEHQAKEALLSFVKLSKNQDRFENIYDGWIENAEQEIVVLEAYSVILQTKSDLEEICVSEELYTKFKEQQKEMLRTLLRSKNYTDTTKLLSMRMYDDAFKEEKISELYIAVLMYLTKNKLPLPKKIIEQLYIWVENRRLPSYLVIKEPENFQFDIVSNRIDSKQVVDDMIKAIEKKKQKIDKVVDKHFSL